METQSSLELQDWQKEILEMEFHNKKEFFELKPQQKKMLEELLYPTDSNPYWVEEEYKRFLERVLWLGYYKEEDKETLNYARECYLKGNNWIK
jgi:hypothetical protein